jgi:UDP-N-acetylmuramate dehydrogenase
MTIEENVAVGSKTTMRIGGKARYYGELKTKEDVEEAWQFAQEKKLPLIVLGGGANTIFADGTIEALVVRMKADAMQIDGNRVRVEAGKILGSFINELAARDLDFSALTGIPGTIGGSIFGNAGQGPGGPWIDSFVESVTAFVDGAWRTFSRDECEFRYRESAFKDMPPTPILWEATLTVPSRPAADVKAEVERLLKRRIETQPHLKTAGSCFKALPDGTPAWKLIDAAGLRGLRIGGVQVAEKHANFLLNVEQGTFADALAIVRKIRDSVPQIAGVEMRFYGEEGRVVV